ncbi:uncharacterized protein B0I36DRAFT_348781 [Microdochium trichocladiopsis]|uniref:Uncharacterized protein n=1 Tax=Microdochium trichocladiopsis TaxID=1682393 RepID=A0A9P8Y5X5_9PEZI|nr:uncharacterized protein B0I36DRAFT_348781 [Microdochium trichocladiopsis]KAH7030567.1 hypothetical protein B0I36DRAFT_348781 [Microdochium trichocladiopsis]
MASGLAYGVVGVEGHPVCCRHASSFHSSPTAASKEAGSCPPGSQVKQGSRSLRRSNVGHNALHARFGLCCIEPTKLASFTHAERLTQAPRPMAPESQEPLSLARLMPTAMLASTTSACGTCLSVRKEHCASVQVPHDATDIAILDTWQGTIAVSLLQSRGRSSVVIPRVLFLAWLQPVFMKDPRHPELPTEQITAVERAQKWELERHFPSLPRDETVSQSIEFKPGTSQLCSLSTSPVGDEPGWELVA